MVVYIETGRESTGKLVELIELSKIEYKDNIKNSFKTVCQQ